MTAKRAPPLPGDHNQLYQVATSQSHSASVRRAYPRRAIVRPPAVDELRRIHLLRTPVHKGKKRRGPGLITSRPSPLLASVVGVHSFLALLLSASQEVVRDPPYGVCGPAYRIGDPTYRSPRGYFEEANFIPLHPGHRPPASLRRLLAQSVGPFLRGAQGLFALPEGYPDHLATLAISEGDDPFEPWVHLLSLGQDHLSGMAHAFV